MFPGNGWFGLELDVFNSTPHIKNLDNVPGIHMRVTNVGVNLLARYPGVTFQPYVGIGAGAAIARMGTPQLPRPILTSHPPSTSWWASEPSSRRMWRCSPNINIASRR